MTNLPERVRRDWPQLSGPGVVAVSGGADSVALLRILEGWAAPLIVAHVNHRLRGADSDADEQFVRELSASLGLPFQSIAVDAAGEARRDGANLENAARRLRYDWLARVARESGATWIATGHSADDQAETVLHRFMRGTGIQGLRGIARRRPLQPGINLVRPLLGADRTEIVKFLNSIGQPWREDQSNRDPAFTRNRIRHELLPLLRSFNPSVVDVLGRLSEQANELHDIMATAARDLLAQAELPAAGPWRIFAAAALESAAPHCLRGMFRLLWEREGWPMNDMSFDHWKRLVEVAVGTEKAVDLPGGVRACRGEKVVKVGLRDASEPKH
jgi:tRNA(Ile)-lysidine synthase